MPPPSVAVSSPRAEIPVERQRTILASMEDYQVTQPGQTAFRDLGQGADDSGQLSVTFSELADRAAICGEEIRNALQWRRKSEPLRVVLQFSPGIDYIVALLGCWEAGATAVPAYLPRSNRHSERLARILADCRPDLILTSPQHSC